MSEVDEVFTEVSAFIKDTYDSLDIWVITDATVPTIAVKSSTVSPETDGAEAVNVLSDGLKGLLYALTGEQISDRRASDGSGDLCTLTCGNIEVQLEEDAGQKPKASHVEMYVFVTVVRNWLTTNEGTDRERRQELFAGLKEAWDEFFLQVTDTFGEENVKKSSLQSIDRLQLTSDMQPPELAAMLKGILYVVTGDKPKIGAPFGYKKAPYRGATWKVSAKHVEVSFYGIIDVNTKEKAYTVSMTPRFPDVAPYG